MWTWVWLAAACVPFVLSAFVAYALCAAASAGDADLADLERRKFLPAPPVGRAVAGLAPDVERVVELAAGMLDADLAALMLEDGGWSSTGTPLRPGEEPRRLVSGPKAAASAPVPIDRDESGCLQVISSQPGRRFEARELELLAVLADTAGAALVAKPAASRIVRLAENVETLAATLEPSRRDLRWRGGDFVALAASVGRRAGLEGRERAELELAARLLDVGLLRVPVELMTRPGELAPGELAVVRRHPVWGADALVNVPGLAAVSLVVRCHHERWDGTGYPHGLAGARIPAAARVLAATDTWWAMTSDRPHAPAMSAAEAALELQAAGGSQLDPEAVEAVLAEVAAGVVVA